MQEEGIFFAYKATLCNTGRSILAHKMYAKVLAKRFHSVPLVG